MAADAQVKEITLLREYANRLDSFKDAILGGCVVLQNKAESILDNLQREKTNIERGLDNCQTLSSRTVEKYEDIIDRYRLTSSSSIYLGTTADDAKSKFEEIKKCAMEIKDKIAKVNSIITGLQERTAAYAMGIREMTNSGGTQLKKRIEILEKYKELQA